MCEGVDVCPGTGRSIENAPYRMVTNFGVTTENTLDEVWVDFQRAMELEDAAKKGMTGYQMMNR